MEMWFTFLAFSSSLRLRSSSLCLFLSSRFSALRKQKTNQLFEVRLLRIEIFIEKRVSSTDFLLMVSPVPVDGGASEGTSIVGERRNESVRTTRVLLSHSNRRRVLVVTCKEVELLVLFVLKLLIFYFIFNSFNYLSI